MAQSAKDYLLLSKKYDAYKHQNLINGSKKMQMSFENVFLDQVSYLDFYSIERFGKTKLGQLLLYAKQSQNKALIKELVQFIKPTFQEVIKNESVDALAFTPPRSKEKFNL